MVESVSTAAPVSFTLLYICNKAAQFRTSSLACCPVNNYNCTKSFTANTTVLLFYIMKTLTGYTIIYSNEQRKQKNKKTAED